MQRETNLPHTPSSPTLPPSQMVFHTQEVYKFSSWTWTPPGFPPHPQKNAASTTTASFFSHCNSSLYFILIVTSLAFPSWRTKWSPRSHPVSFGFNWCTVRCVRFWRSCCLSLLLLLFILLLISSHSLPQLPLRNGLTHCKPLSNSPQESLSSDSVKNLFLSLLSSNPLPVGSLACLSPDPQRKG